MPSRFIVPKDGRCPDLGSNQSGKIMRTKAGGGRIGRLEGGKMEGRNFENLKGPEKHALLSFRASAGTKLAVLSLLGSADCLPKATVP